MKNGTENERTIWISGTSAIESSDDFARESKPISESEAIEIANAAAIFAEVTR